MATESIVKQALKCCLFFLLSLCFTRFSLFSSTQKKVVEDFMFAIIYLSFLLYCP